MTEPDKTTVWVLRLYCPETEELFATVPMTEEQVRKIIEPEAWSGFGEIPLGYAAALEELKFMTEQDKSTVAKPEAIRTVAERDLADYLLSEEYRRLLYRAVLARFGTTSTHHTEHGKALTLINAAFPELEA